MHKSILNSEGTDSRGNIMLLGKSTRLPLQQQPFPVWFNNNYGEYRIDSSTAHTLKSNMRKLRFGIFIGRSVEIAGGLFQEFSSS